MPYVFIRLNIGSPEKTKILVFCLFPLLLYLLWTFTSIYPYWGTNKTPKSRLHLRPIKSEISLGRLWHQQCLKLQQWPRSEASAFGGILPHCPLYPCTTLVVPPSSSRHHQWSFQLSPEELAEHLGDFSVFPDLHTVQMLAGFYCSLSVL